MNSLTLSGLRQWLADDPLAGLRRRRRVARVLAEGGTPVLDLLREQRREIGQQPIASVLAERRALLLQGTTIGAVLLGVVMGITALVYLRHQMVKAQMGQLNAVESQAAALRQQLAQRQKGLATIVDINRQLSGALSNVRPTSALMSDLQLRTPEGVQLVSADASSNLLVKGVARDPMAFARINALQLELGRSPLLDQAGITLSKLERKDPPGRTGPGQSLSSASPVHFEITGRFAQLSATQLEQILRRLGSSGMARRLELLQKEGLLP